MKRVVLWLLIVSLRIYFRKVPFEIGKVFFWQKIVARYIQWRDIRTKVRTKFNCSMEIDLRDSVQRFIYFFGVFEPAITRYVAERLRPGDVFIDIGANVGYYTLLASKLVGPNGEVFAFEASPSIFETLCRNLKENSATNVHATNTAIAAEVGEATVYLHSEINLGGTTIMPTIAARRAAQAEAVVLCKPLPEAAGCNAVRRARFIKIDVEGAEWKVLLGLRELLPTLSHDTEILVEVDRNALSDQEVSFAQLLDLFSRADFKPFIMQNEYNERFYIRKLSDGYPRPLHEKDASEVVDLVFRRSDARSS